MSTIQIFGFAPSTYTRTARMTCIEKGAPHTLEPLVFGQESHRAMHPFLKMPAMRHDGRMLYETLAIATYLDSVFDGPPLTPADPFECAQMFSWISAQIDYVYPAVVGILASETPPNASQVETARQSLSVCDARLRERTWLAGDDLSLADLFLAPMIAFATSLQAGPSLLSDFSGLDRWRSQIDPRPSFTETQP